MLGMKKTESVKYLFTHLKILTVYTSYIRTVNTFLRYYKDLYSFKVLTYLIS